MNTDSDSPEHHLHGRVASLEDSRRSWRWIVGLGAPFVLAIMLWAIDQVRTSSEHVGATRATIESFGKSLDKLDLDVRELRSKIIKLSGVDPDPGLSIVQR